MKEHNIEILNRLDKENLERIKVEAEFHFDDVEKADNIISSKANSFFQILLVIEVPLVAYIINNLPVKLEIPPLVYQISLMSAALVAHCIYLLIEVLFPVSTWLKGAKPSDYLQDDIFPSDKDADTNAKSFLRTTIFSLEKHINKNILIQSQKSNNLRKSKIRFLYGLICLLAYTVVFYCVTVI